MLLSQQLQRSTSTVSITMSNLSLSVLRNVSKAVPLTFLRMPSKGTIGTVMTISAGVSTRRDIFNQTITILTAPIPTVRERVLLASQRMRTIGSVPNFLEQTRISWMFKSVVVHWGVVSRKSLCEVSFCLSCKEINAFLYVYCSLLNLFTGVESYVFQLLFLEAWTLEHLYVLQVLIYQLLCRMQRHTPLIASCRYNTINIFSWLFSSSCLCTANLLDEAHLTGTRIFLAHRAANWKI